MLEDQNRCNRVSLGLVGWGVDQSVGGFGDEPGIKAQMMTLIRSVRTVMRGACPRQRTMCNNVF